MIDLVVYVQAVVAGAVLWRAAHEGNRWDAAGFALLAAAALLMTMRRVTARLDNYIGVDRVVLPQIITWLMAMAVACFVIEMFHRLRSIHGTFHNPRRSGILRYFMPFCMIFLLAATDFIPQPKMWDGVSLGAMTLDDAIIEASIGDHKVVAMEQMRWHCSRAIETLTIAASGQGAEAEVARRKLDDIANRAKAASNR